MVQSYSSASSESDPLTDSSSSSSYDDELLYSQAVVGAIGRTTVYAYRSIYVDLSLLDQNYQIAMGATMVETGLTHSGTYYPGEPVLLADGAILTLRIDRQTLLGENQLFAAWVDAMLGRIRGPLSVGRQEAQAALDLDISEYRII